MLKRKIPNHMYFENHEAGLNPVRSGKNFPGPETGLWILY